MNSDTKKRIIIVEDEAIIAIELKHILESIGYKVVGHSMNGDKALDLFATTQADLILLDINIKGSLNGIDLAKIIRKKYKIPFIFLTSFSDSATIEKVQKLFPSGYIVKPFTENDLKVNIKLAIHKDLHDKKQQEFTQEYAENKLGIKLNPREYDVLKAFKDGLTYKEAAEKLFISVNTFKFYQKQLFRILDVKNKHELLERLQKDNP